MLHRSIRVAAPVAVLLMIAVLPIIDMRGTLVRNLRLPDSLNLCRRR
jgi:hypothetical protein